MQFPNHQGKVRPGIANKKFYQSNKSILKQNIALFKKNQFLIKQYNMFKKGVDKGAPEYYWGYQPNSSLLYQRTQHLLQEQTSTLDSQISQKLRLQTLVILNQDINSNALDTTLKNQSTTLTLLTEKLKAMKQTNIFLNKLQNQYMVVDQNNMIEDGMNSLPSVKHAVKNGAKV
jgi:hypothetical protein